MDGESTNNIVLFFFFFLAYVDPNLNQRTRRLHHSNQSNPPFTLASLYHVLASWKMLLMRERGTP